MAAITKIYELKTLGYGQIITELKNVEKSFIAIKQLKEQLNKQKISTTDAQQLIDINKQLQDQKIKTEQLRLERQRLINEGKILQNQKQQEINTSKAAQLQMSAEAGSINQLKQQLKELNVLRNNLNPNSGSTISFRGQTLNFEQARAQAISLSTRIRELGGTMNGVNDIGTRMTNAISAGFQKMKGSLAAMIVTYTGWFAAFREAGSLINENIKMSDSFADLQIRIKGTKGDVDQLFASLKRIDTRTSLKDLVDIANVVAKKGVAKEDIASLTAEFDKLNVVLGSEIGDKSTATANIIKLITIFNDDKHVTAERVREIGTELFKLTTTGVATGEFLVNFAERVGAVRGITGLTLPNILGMGAALQQLGQRTEVAGTAAVQLTTKLFTNVEKFAKAAQIPVEEFRKLLADNPFEALIKVGEGLKNLGDKELGENFEEVVQAFGEVGVVGVRVKAVLGDIATNGRFVQQRMKEAAVSTEDFARQSEAAELKQHTFAATLDRVRKQLESIGTNKSVQVTLAAIASVILFLIGNLGTIVTLLALYASAWVIANSQMIAAALATRLSNIAFVAQYAILVITTTFTRAYTAALGLFTGATRGATAATTLLSIALKLLPLGIIISLLALFAAGCRRAASGVTGTTDTLRKQAEQLRINQEINIRANEIVGEQVSKYETLVAIVTSTVTSYDTSRKALDELITMNSRFNAALKDNVINLNEVKRALAEVRAEIILNARAQAAAELTTQKYKDYLNIVTVRQKIEADLSNNNKINTSFQNLPKGPLRDSFFDALGNPVKAGYDPSKSFIFVGGVGYDAKTFFDNLKKQETEKLNGYQAYLDISTKLEQTVIESQRDKEKIATEIEKTNAQKKINDGLKQVLSIDELEEIIKLINSIRDKLKEGDPQLDDLLKKRDIFQKRLDKLKNKKQPTYFGARIPGEEKDQLSIIEAGRREELAAEESYYASLRLNHQLNFNEELQYAEDIRDTNQKFLDQKIKYLENQKVLNAKEKETLAGFKKEKIDIELKFLDDVQAIYDREFDQRKLALKNQLEQNIADLRLSADEIEQDPRRSATERAQAKKDADLAILTLQVQFNKDIDALEKQFHQRSKNNSRESAKEILKTQKDLLDDEKKLAQARITDIRDAGDREVATFEANYQKLRTAIINNDKLTANQRKTALEKLDKQYRVTILSAELARLTIEFQEIERQYNKGLISEKQYLEAKAALEKKANDLAQARRDAGKGGVSIPGAGTTQDTIQDQLRKLFKFEEGSSQDQLLGNVIATSFSVASQAMTNYFDAEENRIRQSLQMTLDRMDVERDQVKARAQTSAELEAIDKQYAAKKAKAEREAGEKLKKQKRAEAKIALATELANIAVSAASNPLNGVTLGIAGIVMYALLAGLAVARYSLNVQSINREQFRYGGGITKGKTHEQGGERFAFGGRIYEDEVDELHVIRTKDVNPNSKYTITGTQRQIASNLNVIGGGGSFSTGGKVKKMFADGGFLGSNYPAPYFQSSINNNSDIQGLVIETRNMVIATNSRIDRLSVHQDTDTVTDAQRKQVKQSKLGSM